MRKKFKLTVAEKSFQMDQKPHIRKTAELFDKLTAFFLHKIDEH